MSASRIASRNSAGPSKSWILTRTLPSPWATWLSEPAPGTIRYLRAKRSASSLKALTATRGLKTSSTSTSSTMLEQVLVVGHRVEAVEGMRARRRGRPGGGSRRSSRPSSSRAGSSPRGRGRSPRPASAVFTSSATITLRSPISAAIRRASKRSGDLVVVGDRDRTQPAVARRLQQHLDRRRAVGRVVGVHVQVDLDQRPVGDPAPRLGVAAAVVATGREAPVDRLEARPPPAPSHAPAPAASTSS